MRKLMASLALLVWVCTCADAAEVFGTVDEVSGSATVAGEDGSTTAVAVGLKIYEKDTVSTGHDAEVHIATEDGAFMALRPDTVFRVDEYRAEGGESDRTFVSLLTGALRSVTGWIGKHDHAAYRITTPTATIGVRGTDHEVTVIDKADGDEPGTYDTVNEGATLMKTPRGEAEGAPGKFVFAPKGRAAAPAVLAQRPRFWGARKLRLEGRIQQRKDYLRAHFEQMREERNRDVQRNHPERRRERREEMRSQGHAQGQTRERAGERAQAMERRNETRENRAQQIQRRREELRERRQGQQQEEKQRQERKRHARHEHE